ncbi:MAG: hypothetical protein BAJALOKI1v1_2150001 [Promethearchaeota archaeon]|nr:MAG: hypothetical protein BAJALOKI1v1_2150001 [Candidatus Lokiarchaeota archaeon]
MVKVNPLLEEPISERILNKLLSIIRRIKETQKQNPNQIITEEIDIYYNKRRPIEHKFSDELLDVIKRDLILIMIDVNKNSFRGVSQTVMNRLVTFLIDCFIDHYSKWQGSIEVSEALYLIISYGLLAPLEKYRDSDEDILEFENWLKKNLNDKWEDLKEYFNQFKKKIIHGKQFLKYAIELFGDKEFSELLLRFPKLQQHKKFIESNLNLFIEENL